MTSVLSSAGLSGAASRLAAIATLLLCPAAAQAQTATVTGAVQDAETGAPIERATVLLAGTPFSVTTGAQGTFAFNQVAAGRFTLQVVAIGYAADSVPGIVLAEGERRSVTVSLHRIPLILQDIVVTATRTAEQSGQSTVSIATLPSRDIVQRNVTTVDQALVYVPGVTFNGPDQLDIRGAGGMARGIGSRVLMMLDGHPILTGDGGEINFSSVPLLDLDRSEIVKGAYSAVYGTNALGGVVNLITTPIGSTPQTAFRARGEAYDYQPDYKWSDGMQSLVGLGVQHSRRIGDVGARAYFGYDRTDGFTQNGESNRWLARVKLASLPGSSHPWDAFGIVTRDRAGEFFIWRSADQPYEVPEDVLGNHTVFWNVLTGGSVTAYARGTTLVRLSPYFNVNSTENHFTDNDDWHTAYKPGLLADVSWYAGEHHAVTFGVDGAGTWVRSNYIGQPNILDLAGFAQDEIRLSETLRGSLGLRLDHHDVDLSPAEWSLSPKVGAALQVAPQATVRASVGAGYRAPSAIEQFVSSTQFGFQVVPNPELRGERAWSAEMGTTVTVLNRVRVDAALFGSTYRDLIGPAPAPGQGFVFQFQNISRARVGGADLGVNAQVVPGKLEVQASYLLLGTEDLNTGEPLPYRSRHNVTGSITAFEGLAGLDIRYRSRVEEVLVFPLDERSAWTVVDLRFGYRVLGMLWQLKLANVLNKFYVDVQERRPGAPRSIAVTAVHGL